MGIARLSEKDPRSRIDAGESFADIMAVQTEDHIVNLYDYLRQGDHSYAFEWDRNQGFEDSLRNLVNVWLSEACQPGRWRSNEERYNLAVLNGADF